MNKDQIEAENAALRWSWDRYPEDHLDSYLVAGVEDPRINIQSILTRGLLSDSLFPNAYTGLIREELRFGAVLTWLLREIQRGHCRSDILTKIEAGDFHAMPRFIAETATWLRSDACPVPDYITMALDPTGLDESNSLLSPLVEKLFCDIWSQHFAGCPISSVRILEPACGSANDYRIIHQSGLARLIHYVGLDISQKNIANAHRRFPDVDFRVGSILNSELPSDAFDYVFVHDLFEHLSGDGIVLALSEIIRLARREAWVHLFNSKPTGEHVIVPAEHYHQNTISCEALRLLGQRCGCETEVIMIADFLRDQFGWQDYYNPRAATLLFHKQVDPHM